MAFISQMQDAPSIVTALGHLLDNYLGDYKSIPNLMISIPLFLFFRELNLGCNKYINALATSAFAVYLVHQGPGVQDPLWRDLYQCDIYLHGEHPIVYMIFVVLSVYLAISALDYIRIRFIEPYCTRTKPYLFLRDNIDKFYSCVAENPERD